MFTGFGGRGDFREGYQFEDLCIDKKRVGKWIFERQNCRLCTGLIQSGTWTSDWLF
jgi:hypothetical protein